MSKRWVIRIVILLIILVGVYGLRIFTIDKVESDLHDKISALLTGLPSYSVEQDYIIQLFEQNHSPVFRDAITMKVGREGTDVDYDKYLDELFSKMSSQADADGKAELAIEYKALRSNIHIEGK